MRMMNVLGQVYGLVTVSSTTTLLQSLTIVSEARYSAYILVTLFDCCYEQILMIFAKILISGNYNVSFRPPNVFVGLSRKSKSGVPG